MSIVRKPPLLNKDGGFVYGVFRLNFTHSIPPNHALSQFVQCKRFEFEQFVKYLT